MSEKEDKRNEVKVTRPDIDILVSTPEPLEKAVSTVNELMDKYGKTEKKSNAT